jgi:anti-anti-sigma factor
MASEVAIFVVEQAGERTVVRLHDWQTSMKMFYWPSADSFAARVRSQLDELISEQHCRTLAINMSSVNLMPSAFLGVLISLCKGGVQIELLHPSPSVREALHVTKLDQFFVVRD